MITTKILTYLCGALLVAILGLGLCLHIVKVERDGYKGALAGFKSAQATNLGTIKMLQDDLADIQRRTEANLAQGERDAVDAQKEIDARNVKTVTIQTTRDRYYAKQPATDCGNVLVPDAVLDGLR